MPATITADQATAMRMRAQGLDSPPAPGGPAERVAEAARRCGGIQAQDLHASRLAARARVDSLRLPDVTAACDAGQAVVRSWFMRGTLHMVAAEDARWLIALLGPVTIAKYRGRRAKLGLDEDLCAAAVDALEGVLAAGPLDRKAIMAALRAGGVPVPGGQAPAHLLIYAACRGVIARGPDRRSESTYALVTGAEQDPQGWDDTEAKTAEAMTAEAMTALARRYFAAFSPAGAEDFSSWAGLPARACAAAIGQLRGELAEVLVHGRQMWVPAQWLDAPMAPEYGRWQLLPAFDTYLIGYRNRELLIEASAARFVYAGGGWIHPAVMRDGRIVGSWRLRGRGAAATVDVMLFDGSAPPKQLATVIGRLGTFLGLSATMRGVTSL